MAVKRTVKWLGSKECDFCHTTCKKDLYDGMTTFGAWAVMCPSCFIFNGRGVGPGVGQHYHKDKNGDFVKIEG